MSRAEAIMRTLRDEANLLIVSDLSVTHPYPQYRNRTFILAFMKVPTDNRRSRAR